MLSIERHSLRSNIFLLHDGDYRVISSIGLNFTLFYMLLILFHQKSQSLILIPSSFISKSLINVIEKLSNKPYINSKVLSISLLISDQHQTQSHYSKHTHNGLTINTSFARHCLSFRKSRSHMMARIKLLISWISFKNLSLHILSAIL